MVSSGIDYVELVNTVYFLKAALIIPLGLAIFWRRMTSTAFVTSLLLAIAVGYPVREFVGELPGIITLEAISLVAAVGISLLSKQSFDFDSLRSRRGALSEDKRLAAADLATSLEGEAVRGKTVDPDPVR